MNHALLEAISNTPKFHGGDYVEITGFAPLYDGARCIVERVSEFHGTYEYELLMNSGVLHLEQRYLIAAERG